MTPRVWQAPTAFCSRLNGPVLAQLQIQGPYGERHLPASLWTRPMHALEREECGSVGDGKKGILIAPPVGTSFACPAHSALRAACTHEEEELNAILSGLERTQASEPS